MPTFSSDCPPEAALLPGCGSQPVGQRGRRPLSPTGLALRKGPTGRGETMQEVVWDEGRTGRQLTSEQQSLVKRGSTDTRNLVSSLVLTTTVCSKQAAA